MFFASWLMAAVVLLAAAAELRAAQNSLAFSVAAGQHDRVNTPVCVEITIDPTLKNAAWATLTDSAGNSLFGQVTAPSLLATPAAGKSGEVARELHFILPNLKAGQTADFTAEIMEHLGLGGKAPTQFQWHDTPGDHDDLTFGNRPVLRYMYHPLDESSDDARMATFKPYHHVFDPDTGTQLLTKGPEGQPNDWPHHHGVFYGFRHVTYDGGKKVDIWHCPAAFQEHSAFLASEAGPVLGRQLMEISWVAEPSRADGINHYPATPGAPNATFAKEQREVTVYAVPGGTLLQFASRLNAVLPPVHLDGDPQHAGFHFRANLEVMKETNDQTYFLRPDGKGPLTVHKGKGNQGDETRNWEAKGNPPDARTVNMPWDAMSFVVAGKRYTVAYLDNDKNPKPSRGSEREYGRIGNYFVADLNDPEKPLNVDYQLWIQSGETTVDQCAALDADFNDPPTVTLK
ncbi:MAG TPA: DUF6807 family protein [Pirellulales bacterium]|nr:DUF6807 family protein [Pirellulales bacterium]